MQISYEMISKAIGVRAGGGGEGGVAAPPVTEIFEIFRTKR